MKVTVKLFADFRLGRFKIEEFDFTPGTTPGDVISRLEINVQEIGVLMVNGRHVTRDHQLKEGETLSIFPLVGGG